MRTLLLCLALPLLAPAGLSAQATDRSEKSSKTDTSSSTEKWPDSIGGRPLSAWMKDLKSGDPGVVEAAIRTVPVFGPEAKDAVPDLILMLTKHPDASLRINSAIALMSIEVRDSDAKEVVKALSAAISKDPQVAVRFHAAVTVGRFEEEAVEAIPALVGATKDTSWEIRKAACASLARAGMNTKEGPDARATNGLIGALNDKAAKVRLEATMGLGLMGAPQNPQNKLAVIKALQGRLNDTDKTVSVWAYVGLMALDKVDDTYLGPMSKLLTHPETSVRVHTARALGVMGKEAKSKVPDLLSALKDKEAIVAGMSCWALGEMSKSFDPGPGAVTALKEVTERKEVDPALKAMAMDTLKQIEGTKKPK